MDGCSYKNITKRFQKYHLSNKLFLSFFETIPIDKFEIMKVVWYEEMFSIFVRDQSPKSTTSSTVFFIGVRRTPPTKLLRGRHVARSPLVYTCDSAVSHLTIPKVPPRKEAGANS